MREIIWFLVGGILLGGISGLLQPKKSRRKKRKRTNSPSKKKVNTTGTNHRSSKTCRPDEVILTIPLSNLNGTEFERLLALYFRDNGYIVHEVGIGGNDGGVDLVIVDKRGEKTAVQAKCYADHNMVPVQTVRELVAAKRNHDCMLTLIVTTSDLTGPAKKEAEQFRMEYWHGGVIEEKLKRWGKWTTSKKKKVHY